MMDIKPDASQLAVSSIPASSPSTLDSAEPSRRSPLSPDSQHDDMEVDLDARVASNATHLQHQPTKEVGEDGIEVDARWNDRSAGFSLLSSDNVRFYVPIYHLQSMSVPLRHLVKDKTELKFDSELIDDADTLLLILHAMTSADPTAAARFSPFDFCLDLLWASRFAEKYECAQIQTTIKFWLKDYITSTVIAPLDILIIACKTSAHDIAAQAVKRSFTAKDTEDSVYSPWGRIEGEGRLDLKKMSKRIWSELSGEYLWALTKVFKRRKGSEDLTGTEAERLFSKHVLS